MGAGEFMLRRQPIRVLFGERPLSYRHDVL
jgi:hypothetical protein